MSFRLDVYRLPTRKKEKSHLVGKHWYANKQDAIEAKNAISKLIYGDYVCDFGSGKVVKKTLGPYSVSGPHEDRTFNCN